MEPEELERAVEAILFAAGEPVELKRLSQALGCEPGEVQEQSTGWPINWPFNGGEFGWYGWMGLIRCARPGRWRTWCPCLETRKLPSSLPLSWKH